MIVIENGDLLEGDATTAAEVDFTIHGLDNNALVQFADGQLANSKGTLYTANSTDVVSAIILVNTGAAHNHVNLYSKSSGGTSRRLIPKDLQLESGYSLHFDGATITVMDLAGGIIYGQNVSDVAYAASWDGVTTIAPSKNAVYDQIEAHKAVQTGIHGLAITAGKTLTVSDTMTLALGAANLKQFMNAGATALEWARGIKLSNFNRAVGGDDADTAYTGVGFKPSAVLFICATGGIAIPGGALMSIGFSDGTEQYCVTNFHNQVAYTWAYDTAAAIAVYESSTKYTKATITTMDADGFTMHWVNTGGMTAANLRCMYIALR